MANTSSYSYAKHTPTYQVQGWYKNESGLLVMGLKEVQGLQLFGGTHPPLAEEDLTDELVEYILSDKYKNELTGKNIFAEYLIKNKKDKN